MSILRRFARRILSRDLDVVMDAETFRILHPDVTCPRCGANVSAIAGRLANGASGVGWFCACEWRRFAPMRRPASA